MVYDIKKATGFGKRIATRRDAMGLKQMDLASLVWPECFDYEKTDEKTRESKRKAIVGYEHGRQPKDTETFLKLCNVLGCELDYLAGVIDLPTRQQTDICAETCLSPKALEVIISARDTPALSALNSLLEYRDGLILDLITEYLSFSLKDEVWIYDDGTAFIPSPAQMIGDVFATSQGLKGEDHSRIDSEGASKIFLMRIEDMLSRLREELKNSGQH